jgi:hypothetical protein
MTQVANSERLDVLELLWLTKADRFRSTGEQPPIRGTFVSLDERRHILYSSGAVRFYKTYPGHYVAQPLGIRTIDVESSPEELATEVLALTRMNRNQTRLDGRIIAITLTAERTVGNILRHHDDGAPSPRGMPTTCSRAARTVPARTRAVVSMPDGVRVGALRAREAKW